MLQSKQNKTCSCHNGGLCLDNRHLSWALAVVILLSFGFFMAGYFFGKRKIMRDLHVTLDQDSLADTIYTSLCTMQDSKTVVAQQDKDEIESSESSDLECGQSQAIDTDASAVQACTETVNAVDSALKPEVTQMSQKKYFAQLVGFGTQQAAHAFAQRLQQKNMPVVVKDRHSKTAKGKKITWYQVITEQFNSKNELEKIVDEIKVKERLKDVRIITC